MPYRIMHRGEAIGTSDLESLDRGMGVAFGAFCPAPAYDAVRAVFLMFTAVMEGAGYMEREKLLPYYQARDALDLSLETESGERLSTSYIHIIDWGGDERGDLEVQAQIADPRFWAER